MATNPFPYASSDTRIAGEQERGEYLQAVHDSVLPTFKIMNLEDYVALRDDAPEAILGATVYTSQPDRVSDLHPFEMVSTLPPIESKSRVECYRFPRESAAPAISRSQKSELRISYTADFAFGHWETELAAPHPVEDTTYRAYRSILNSLRETGSFHLWRCWNIIPDIHKTEGAVDRYMQFCLGRHKALLTDGNLTTDTLPAASAVGSRGNRLQVSFVAGRKAGKTFENPDQLSAYSYPRQYGPASPSFSRSLLAGDHLWLSGTASIAGHRTLHANDLAGQVHETASRINTLIANVEKQRGLDIAPPKHLKVFLRHRETADELMPLLRSAFPGETSFHLVEADICRDDLLIEIEGATT